MSSLHISSYHFISLHIITYHLYSFIINHCYAHTHTHTYIYIYNINYIYTLCIYIIGIYNLQPRSYSLDFLGIQRRGGRGSWRCRSRKSRRGTHGGAERGTRGNPQGRGSAPSWAMGPWEIMGMCWVDSVDHRYNMDIMVDPVSWCMICSQEVSLTCFKNKKNGLLK